MTTLFQSIGGLGLFLLGMIIMTDALHALAGKVVRDALMHFTRSPLSGAVTGALATAILQSSSATTVAAVGFVGAGLIGFPESLGIIFGANIGTTLKGWLIALFGFKFQLEIILLPVIFIGSALRLFGNRTLAQTGMAVAGFAIIFVGIGYMQQGMNGLQDLITPYIFSGDSFAGRLKLVAMGIIFTVITQSSSAGVAVALTAVYTGAINFEQAAALVIGMDVGTTVTAAMATIGGSVGSRRTGFSHVIYNCLTGIMAFILLTPYVLFCEHFFPALLDQQAEVALVGFHSTFNIIGVVVILPFTHRFTRFMQHLIPDVSDAYTQSLDKKLLIDPDLALTAAQTSIHIELLALLKHLAAMLAPHYPDTHVKPHPANLNLDTHNPNLDTHYIQQRTNLADLQTALDETHAYVDLIHLERDREPGWQILIAIIHSLDHMQRLHERCEQDVDRAEFAHQTPELAPYIQAMSTKLQAVILHIENNQWQAAEEKAREIADIMSTRDRDIREIIMSKIGEGKINVISGTNSLEAIRWLRRISAHVLRVTHHQATAQALLSRKP